MKFLGSHILSCTISSLALMLAGTGLSLYTSHAGAADIPPGFHRMPDGTLMANNKSVDAPEGYHLMPDGTLMKNSGGDSGMWMFEYQYMRMNMEGLLDTTKELTAQDVTGDDNIYNYMMAPTDMTMDMHMFMLMYHTDTYMLMAMAHYLSNEMGMYSSDGTTSTMETSGVGDTELTATFNGPFKLAFTVGLSIPTGSIDERGPMTHTASFTEQDVQYPYGMQLGSGTYDLIQGVSYTDMVGDLGWGVGYEYTSRHKKNDNDYRLGDEMEIDGWLRWRHTSTMNTTAKLRLRSWGQIEGADKNIEERFVEMSPPMDPENYGGTRMDAGLAFKYETPQMTSIGVEFLVPVRQDLYGPQMKTDWIAGISLGMMF